MFFSDRPNYLSEHKDSDLAFWLKAYIHQLDTHVLWSAEAYNRRGENKSSFWLFKNYFSDTEVLHEFIKRSLVVDVEKDETTHILNGAWKELDKTLKACNAFSSIPLTEKGEENLYQYRYPKKSNWFEIVIDSFTDEVVRFSFSLWAYKYHLRDLELSKQNYYLFADQLDARVRFIHDWFPLDLYSKKLMFLLNDKTPLAPVSKDLTHELNLLKKPTEGQIKSSCRSLFPLVERVMRDHSETKNWKGKSTNLDLLINQFEQVKALPSDCIELLRFIVKPKRDYIEHGREIPLPIAKITLTTSLDILCRLAENLK